jgi:hypothetical protein
VPLSVIVATSDWVVKMLDEDRPIVIVGAGNGFTVTEPVPDEVV